MVNSADSCRTGEVESVETVELVCVAGLLRMRGESLLLPCGDLLEVGSLAKGSWIVGLPGQLSDDQEISTGWEQDGLGWGAILPTVPGLSTGWMDTAECRGVVGQRRLFSVVTGREICPRLVLAWASSNRPILEFAMRW